MSEMPAVGKVSVQRRKTGISQMHLRKKKRIFMQYITSAPQEECVLAARAFCTASAIGVDINPFHGI